MIGGKQSMVNGRAANKGAGETATLRIREGAGKPGAGLVAKTMPRRSARPAAPRCVRIALAGYAYALSPTHRCREPDIIDFGLRIDTQG